MLQPVDAHISSEPQEVGGLNAFLPTQSVRQHPGLRSLQRGGRRAASLFAIKLVALLHAKLKQHLFSNDV